MRVKEGGERERGRERERERQEAHPPHKEWLREWGRGSTGGGVKAPSTRASRGSRRARPRLGPVTCPQCDVSGTTAPGMPSMRHVERAGAREACMRRCSDPPPRDAPPYCFCMPRRACHFSASCRVFRVTLRSKLARFELLFVPSSAFFTRFLVLRGTRGVCFADFSQLLPLEPFDSAVFRAPGGV